MNPRNHIHLEGHVYDTAWSRVRTNGEAQVRFQLVVQRLGMQTDIFCCAISVDSVEDTAALEREFHTGRTMSLQGEALVADVTSVRDEPLVLVVVQSYQLDFHVDRAPVETRGRPKGKVSAAHDVELF